MEERRKADGWHIKKEISYGHILTTAVIAFSLLGWANSVDKRLTIVEYSQAHSKEMFQKIDTKLDRFTDKLYREEGR